MIIYFALLIFIIALSRAKYNTGVALLAYFPIFMMLAFKGEVGCDYQGYLNHYKYFNPLKTIMDVRGEISWQAIEYFVHTTGLSYQWYYIFSGAIGVFFLLLAQKHVRSVGLLALIFPIIFVQLGLSGIRQFIAVCIVVYILARYLYNPPKSIYPYLFYVGFAMTFHISAVLVLAILPFLVKLKTSIKILFFGLGLLALTSSFASDVYSTVEFRYLTRTRVSSGAYIRFFLTILIFVLGTFSKKHPYFLLSIIIIGLGLALGVINSITLHRMNYYFYVIAVLLLLRTVAAYPNKRKFLQIAYVLAFGYMTFWFLFSTHSHCIVPYTFSFFNS